MTVSALVEDPEARFEYLVDRDVLVERDDGTVVTDDDFQSTLEVYEDSYLDESDETFAETVASEFDLSPEEAADRIEETGMTREELATFLALRSYLDDPDRSRDELALMAAMVEGVGPGSPVPSALTEVGDEDYEAYVEERGDVVLFVFTRNCAPCDALKEDLPEILEAAPDGVDFAGVNGDEAPAFRRAFEVSVAPTTLAFVGGDLDSTIEGRRPLPRLLDAVEDLYESSGSG